MKDARKGDVSTELLDYTLSWTEPKLMNECVYELKNLPQKSSDYLFSDLKGNAKIGVLRIFKKYGKILKFCYTKIHILRFSLNLYNKKKDLNIIYQENKVKIVIQHLGMDIHINNLAQDIICILTQRTTPFYNSFY